MSHASVQGEKSTSSEIAKLTELTNLGDPGIDAILFWDESGGKLDYLALGSGLSISGTTISASGTGGLLNVVEDLTPQLGGNLDGQSYNITTLGKGTFGAIQVEGVQVILSGAALGTPASGTLTNCTGLPAASVVAGTLVAAMEASDHGAAATDQIINVCYGTGAAPAANTTTEGTIYITYTA